MHLLHLVTTSKALVTRSDALVPRSDALAPSSVLAPSSSVGLVLRGVTSRWPSTDVFEGGAWSCLGTRNRPDHLRNRQFWMIVWSVFVLEFWVVAIFCSFWEDAPHSSSTLFHGATSRGHSGRRGGDMSDET